jgi:hypothetical protein
MRRPVPRETIRGEPRSSIHSRQVAGDRLANMKKGEASDDCVAYWCSKFTAETIRTNRDVTSTSRAQGSVSMFLG